MSTAHRRVPVRLAAWLLFAGGMVLPNAHAAEAAAEETHFGRFLYELTDLGQPHGVAARDDGFVVVETGKHRLTAFAADGKSLWTAGSAGRGRLFHPEDVAVASDGQIVVADTGNHRLVLFDPAGGFQGSIGSHGTALGEFHRPRRIAVNADRIAVIEGGARRVQLLARSGEPLGAVTAQYQSKLALPNGVGLGEDNKLYLSDAVRHRLLRFDASLTLEQTWGDYGSFPGLLSSPAGLALWQNQLFVADAENHWIQSFSTGGKPLDRFGKAEIQPYQGGGRMQIPVDVAVHPEGEFLVIAEPGINRCQVFGREELTEAEATRRDAPRNNSQEPHYAPHLDLADGWLAMTDTEFHRVLLHDVARSPVQRLGRVGAAGRRFGRLMHPGDTCLSADKSHVLVADAGNRRLVLYRIRSPQEAVEYLGDRGQAVRSVDFSRISWPAALRSFPVEPGALERHPGGDLYVVDVNHEAVLVFDPTLQFQRFFGGHGTGRGQFRAPTDLAFAADGKTAYVVDSHNKRVQALSLSGEFRWQIDRTEQEPLSQPYGVAVARNGDVFITDAGTHKVHRYDNHGAWLASFGGRGLSAGEFFGPKGIAVGRDGRIFVVDHGNRRCQIFSLQGEFLDVFGVGWYVRAARPIESEES